MRPEYIHKPEIIAADSFALIRQELLALGYDIEPPLADIVQRIIHSTADFEFAEIIKISPKAIEAGLDTLRRGCAVVCDVNMVRVGISAARLSTFGGTVSCFVADEETRQQAQAKGTTRSAMGIRRAAEQGLIDGGLVVVGNAPTALFEIIQLLEEGHQPGLIVGVPVGFVSTVESKKALMSISTAPWITAIGRKGGSPVAVAIVNALLRLAGQAPPAEID